MKGIRRLSAVLLLAVLLAGMLPVMGAQAAEGEFGVITKIDNLNLRQQASSTSALLGTYQRGDWVRILGESGNWYYVAAPDGRIGYMSRNYVEVSGEITAVIGLVANPKDTSFLNLRAAPTYSASVLGIYYNDVPCVLLSEANGWYHVRINGVEGYFRREFMTIQSQVFSEAVATIVTPGLTGLNLRTGPAKSYPMLAQFPGGKYVMVLQKGNGWWKVSIGGMVGFMDASFLKDGVLSPTEAARQAGQSGVLPGLGYALVVNPKPTQVLNLREGASTAAASIGQFRNGARLTVLNQGTEWCRVMADDGRIGFMMTKYLVLYNLPKTPTLIVTHPQGSFVNLRMAASTYSPVLTRVPHGAAVTVVTPDSEWVRVRYNGMTGYMLASFLK